MNGFFVGDCIVIQKDLEEKVANFQETKFLLKLIDLCWVAGTNLGYFGFNLVVHKFKERKLLKSQPKTLILLLSTSSRITFLNRLIKSPSHSCQNNQATDSFHASRTFKISS